MRFNFIPIKTKTIFLLIKMIILSLFKSLTKKKVNRFCNNNYEDIIYFIFLILIIIFIFFNIYLFLSRSIFLK